MKRLFVLSFACLCLFFFLAAPGTAGAATAGAESPGVIAAYNFPEIEGNIVKIMLYADRYSESIGDKLVLFTESKAFNRPEAGPDAGRSKELYAYGFTLKKKWRSQARLENKRLYP